ncbi:CvpA family protein [Halarcobacter anaerophilus]|uniref:Colicin V synthesis protein n=1 Tax=Halarcobacter anaerophilus TaxID=877500 RepID=A0A4Q0XWX7_9BACT|nr:CvpA family protein [Halarcobacter anaerophilus]QDF28372.1 CvpA family membrane protein [Halarcobacter anaerophilus]RXJ61713.1 colicin V synthesis protein [Halarcobacter anaerophilus]
MQSFTVFDIVIISITVLLGLKGLLRGFIKEIFGLVGIIGGIFVASRMAEEIGSLVAPLLALENSATIKLIGFIIGLVGFWAIIYILGIILSKIFSVSGLGFFDRILGFVFGSAKVFFIFSVIAYALYQVQSFKDLMNNKVSDSITFPLLVKTGGYIVKLDTSDIVKKVENSVSSEDKENQKEEKNSLSQEVSDTVKEIKEKAVESGNAVVDTVKKSVADEISESIQKETKEQIEQLQKEETDINTDNK